MTHDELLAKIEHFTCCSGAHEIALRAVVELHSADYGTPVEDVVCDYCKVIYPCPTIQAIEKELYK